MKLTIVLLIATLFQVRAASYAQAITLQVKDAPLEEVFGKIRLQTGYNFLYDPSALEKTSKVTIAVTNASLESVLDQCFTNQPVTYVISQKDVVISRKSPGPERQAATKAVIKITGQVNDARGMPVPGASVFIKGTNNGVVADANGRYTITVSDNSAVLVISSVGFVTREIAVNSRTTIDVTLTERSSASNEVIVVGYGSQRKADVTGSISSVNEQALKSVPASNLVSALQSQAPGLDIQKAGGNSHPGATPSIAIRGQRSLGGGASLDVLYIVDGIPYNGAYINDLNLDDIVSVQILKDASATAIYGSRGANGVILISTQRGKSGAPIVNYSGYAGVVKPLGHYDVMDTRSYETYKKWGTYNANNPSAIGGANPYKGIDDPKFYTDGVTFLPAELAGIKNGTATDWQKLIFKNGLKTNHQLSVSGGTPTTKYALSAGFYDETGVFPGQSFRRYTFKVSVDQQLGKYVKVGISSLNSVSKINGESINPVGQALTSSPLTVPYDTAGNLIPFPGGGSLTYNPLANLAPGAVVQNRTRYNTFTTAYAEMQLTPHLKYRFNGGIELTPETYGEFYGSATYQNLSGPSTAKNTNYDYYDYTLENLLVYENTFADKHHLTATGLFSYQDDYKASTSFSYNNILADYVQYFNPSLGSNLNGSGNYAKFNIVSFMGRVNYDYRSKYLLTLTMRSDGSSTLAPGNKYHLFPSAAVGWNIAQENFIRNIAVISSLKLRAGYGSVGNAAVAPYQTLGGLAAINYNYGSTNVTGTYPNNVPNPKLGWEYTATLNMGLDFGLLSDRITASVDVYQQRTSNLILPQNLPITTGYTSQFLANVGKTENKGLEVNISSVNIKAASRNDF
ncbi:MAG TPA: SusC/RagA family TonB-linked outer membrane protein, partial [Puia sp.]